MSMQLCNVITDTKYCHPWQTALAEFLSVAEPYDQKLMTSIARISYFAEPNTVLDSRRLLTIRPAGHPNKWWYGYNLSDTTTIDHKDLLPKSNIFVGWVPANEIANVALVGSYSHRTKDFTTGAGVEHIGSTHVYGLKWNHYIRLCAYLHRYYNGALHFVALDTTHYDAYLTNQILDILKEFKI